MTLQHTHCSTAMAASKLSVVAILIAALTSVTFAASYVKLLEHCGEEFDVNKVHAHSGILSLSGADKASGKSCRFTLKKSDTDVVVFVRLIGIDFKRCGGAAIAVTELADRKYDSYEVFTSSPHFCGKRVWIDDPSSRILWSDSAPYQFDVTDVDQLDPSDQVMFEFSAATKGQRPSWPLSTSAPGPKEEPTTTSPAPKTTTTTPEPTTTTPETTTTTPETTTTTPETTTTTPQTTTTTPQTTTTTPQTITTTPQTTTTTPETTTTTPQTTTTLQTTTTTPETTTTTPETTTTTPETTTTTPETTTTTPETTTTTPETMTTTPQTTTTTPQTTTTTPQTTTTTPQTTTTTPQTTTTTPEATTTTPETTTTTPQTTTTTPQTTTTTPETTTTTPQTTTTTPQTTTTTPQTTTTTPQTTTTTPQTTTTTPQTTTTTPETTTTAAPKTTTTAPKTTTTVPTTSTIPATTVDPLNRCSCAFASDQKYESFDWGKHILTADDIIPSKNVQADNCKQASLLCKAYCVNAMRSQGLDISGAQAKLKDGSTLGDKVCAPLPISYSVGPELSVLYKVSSCSTASKGAAGFVATIDYNFCCDNQKHKLCQKNPPTTTIAPTTTPKLRKERCQCPIGVQSKTTLFSPALTRQLYRTPEVIPSKDVEGVDCAEIQAKCQTYCRQYAESSHMTVDSMIRDTIITRQKLGDYVCLMSSGQLLRPGYNGKLEITFDAGGCKPSPGKSIVSLVLSKPFCCGSDKTTGSFHHVYCSHLKTTRYPATKRTTPTTTSKPTFPKLVCNCPVGISWDENGQLMKATYVDEVIPAKEVSGENCRIARNQCRAYCNRRSLNVYQSTKLKSTSEELGDAVCKSHDRIVTEDVLATLQVYFDVGSCSNNMPVPQTEVDVLEYPFCCDGDPGDRYHEDCHIVGVAPLTYTEDCRCPIGMTHNDGYGLMKDVYVEDSSIIWDTTITATSCDAVNSQCEKYCRRKANLIGLDDSYEIVGDSKRVGDEVCEVHSTPVYKSNKASLQLFFDAGMCSDTLPILDTVVDTLVSKFCCDGSPDDMYQEECQEVQTTPTPILLDHFNDWCRCNLTIDSGSFYGSWPLNKVLRGAPKRWDIHYDAKRKSCSQARDLCHEKCLTQVEKYFKSGMSTRLSWRQPGGQTYNYMYLDEYACYVIDKTVRQPVGFHLTYNTQTCGAIQTDDTLAEGDPGVCCKKNFVSFVASKSSCDVTTDPFGNRKDTVVG